MRNEKKLLESYNKQAEIFNSAKTKKLANLNERKNQYKAKIEKYSSLLEDLELQIKNEEEEAFPSFETFRKRAEEQSLQSRQA